MRALFLFLALWARLAPAQGSQGRPSWRYISSEVVIPRKELHHGKGVQMPGWLSYSLRFGGKRHVIHMRRKKLFWSRHLLMMTQDDQGALQMDYPFIPPDCYYLGYLEEIPLSMVTVDTCYGGLEGIMKLDDLAYEIKPLSNSRRFEHIVSQIVADTNATGPTYKLGHKEIKEPLFSEEISNPAPRINNRIFSSHKSMIKGFAQSSNSMYRLYNNVTMCAKFLIDMVSLMDSIYKGLDIKFHLTAVLIFDIRDPVNMNDYRLPAGEYHRFHATYLFNIINPSSSFVVVKEGPQDYQNDPATFALCSPRCLHMVGHLGRHYLLLAVIISQYCGRSIGLYFDNHECSCQRRSSCIMYRYPVLTDSFSNCSFGHLQNILNINKHCLFNERVVFFNTSLTHVRCGNSIVEDREQCDCGSIKQCASNPCCSNNCKLESTFLCDKGLCCTNCTFSAVGTLCRPIRNICDLPEYCTGRSPQCPNNFYMQDGTPCTEEGYCYHGNCTDRTVHCKEIFGANTVGGPDVCYEINKKGHRFGHCKREFVARLFIRCGDQDVKCGRLQCANVTHLPRLQEHVGFHQSKISGVWCWGLDTHRSTGTTDVGHVRPGTPCAPGKFCENSTCNATIGEINYNCFPEKCNRRGICNNNRNCHCHIGWDPPFCKLQGKGGSIDSGPPPRRMRSVRQSHESVIYLRVVFARIYALIAALLFGIATNVKSIKTVIVREENVGEANP
ncbi:disintegrin and metalloproteinase domain-containing protein 29-like [Eumetopias jubatus]|uniref:disintegrin and metalloproteinase domain-containing protein 29-like n=1 Tax=Eumetopias jubatus TaxID=34886 RepID=UPI0010165451|nr:disintegrin and metalloproteinase domain-containing protein 29-like [Eumetopias jubatus]